MSSFIPPNVAPDTTVFKKLRFEFTLTNGVESSRTYAAVLGALWELTIAENWKETPLGLPPETMAEMFLGIWDDFVAAPFTPT